MARQTLDLDTALGDYQVTCTNGTTFLLDLEHNLVLREPAGGHRLPWDGTWFRSELVDFASQARVIRVGNWVRWLLTDTTFILAGPVSRIGPTQAPRARNRANQAGTRPVTV